MSQRLCRPDFYCDHHCFYFPSSLEISQQPEMQQGPEPVLNQRNLPLGGEGGQSQFRLYCCFSLFHTHEKEMLQNTLGQTLGTFPDVQLFRAPAHLEVWAGWRRNTQPYAPHRVPATTGEHRRFRCCTLKGVFTRLLQLGFLMAKQALALLSAVLLTHGRTNRRKSWVYMHNLFSSPLYCPSDTLVFNLLMYYIM